MLKRLFDFATAGAAIVVLGPLLLPIAIALSLTGEHAILYTQERIGRGGRRFSLYKFATMLKDSPHLAGGDITGENDPRVLPFGRILRKSKLNELPQLFNVVLGDMSVIGYRPLTPRVAALFPKEYWEAMSDLRPGLSGIGSIVFRDEERLLALGEDHQKLYSDFIVPHKMALELWYIRHRNFWTDVKLVVLTVFVVAFPRSNLENWLPDLPAPPSNLVALRATLA